MMIDSKDDNIDHIEDHGTDDSDHNKDKDQDENIMFWLIILTWSAYYVLDIK